MLRRWGIFAEEFGAVQLNRIQERSYSGHLIKDIDGSVPNKQWQHPWLLSHRVNLHEKLKALVIETEGSGPPASLHTSSKVVHLDPEKGRVELADGTVVQGDVVLGADGIYVRSLSIPSARLLRATTLTVRSRKQGHSSRTRSCSAPKRQHFGF